MGERVASGNGVVAFGLDEADGAALQAGNVLRVVTTTPSTARLIPVSVAGRKGLHGADVQSRMLQAQWLVEGPIPERAAVQADVGGLGGLIVRGEEQVVGTALDHLAVDLTLGEQGVGGDGLANDVECLEHGHVHADLIGLLALIAGILSGAFVVFGVAGPALVSHPT